MQFLSNAMLKSGKSGLSNLNYVTNGIRAIHAIHVSRAMSGLSAQQIELLAQHSQELPSKDQKLYYLLIDRLYQCAPHILF